MDPSSQRSRGWNFASCKELMLVSWGNIIVLGDLSFAWGEEGLTCWEDDAGSEQLVVILLALSWLSIKLFKFSSILLCNLYFVHLYGQFTSDPRLFMIIDPCSCIVLCCFDSTGTLWSWVYEKTSSKGISEERGTEQGAKRKTEVGLFYSSLIYLSQRKTKVDFTLFVSKVATTP